MRLNIADIKLDTGEHKRAPVELELAPRDEVRFAQPFRGEAEAWNTGDSFLVKARLTGEATLECSRCLTEFDFPLTVNFSEEFRPGQPSPNGEQEEDEEGRTFSRYEGDEIDLSEPFRQSILLELPIKALCTEACKGLCPNCGANLNEDPCRCAGEEKADPRLSALKKLLDRPGPDTN